MKTNFEKRILQKGKCHDWITNSKKNDKELWWNLSKFKKQNALVILISIKIGVQIGTIVLRASTMMSLMW